MIVEPARLPVVVGTIKIRRTPAIPRFKRPAVAPVVRSRAAEIGDIPRAARGFEKIAFFGEIPRHHLFPRAFELDHETVVAPVHVEVYEPGTGRRHSRFRVEVRGEGVLETVKDEVTAVPVVDLIQDHGLLSRELVVTGKAHAETQKENRKIAVLVPGPGTGE